MRRIVQSGNHEQAKTGHESRTVDYASARHLDRNRRVVRPAELIETVQRLDTTTDPATAQAIMRWIHDEYDSRQGGQIVGLFSRCYLGEPYIDHRLDLSGGFIVEHFTGADTPPGPFHVARPFARSSAYTYIEVYDDGTVIPIRTDGRPVI